MSKVMLVEDSLTQAMQIQAVLEASAHSVLHVPDGAQAIENMDSFQPDIVVTDLEMPEMNGLQLVELLQQDHPMLPTILITNRGSEQLAVDALRRGAAGYVPKSMLSPLLAETIENVLGVMRADQSYSSLINCLKENRFTFELPSDPTLISPLVDLVLQVVSGMELFTGTEIVRLSTAIENVLENAVYHGNLELTRKELASCRETMIEGLLPNVVQQRQQDPKYKDRTVRVEVTIGRDAVEVTVEDDGDGFDTSIVPQAGDPDALQDDGGRGLMLIASFVDDLSYNQKGNKVTIVKRRHAKEPAKEMV